MSMLGSDPVTIADQDESPDFSGSYKRDIPKVQNLAKWHFGAFCLHLGVLVLFLGLSQGLDAEFLVPVYTDYPEVVGTDPVELAPITQKHGSYDLIWVAAVISLFTAFSEGYQWINLRMSKERHGRVGYAWYERLPRMLFGCFQSRYYVHGVLDNGIGWVNWVEYSFSAAAITWCIVAFSGVTNFYLVFQLGFISNLAIQYCGYAHEALSGAPRKATDISRFRSRANGDMTVGAKSWSGFGVASFIFVVQWYTLFRYVFSVDTVPNFVYALLFGVCAGYAMFPLVIIWFWCAELRANHFLWLNFVFRADENDEGGMDGYSYRKAFIFLSFTVKLFFAATVIIGVLTM